MKSQTRSIMVHRPRTSDRLRTEIDVHVSLCNSMDSLLKGQRGLFGQGISPKESKRERERARGVTVSVMALCARAPAAAFPKLREASRSRRVRCRASEAVVPVAEEGRLQRPRWSGETPLSKMVGALISFKPLYNLMKIASRQVIIRSLFSLSRSLFLSQDV